MHVVDDDDLGSRCGCGEPLIRSLATTHASSDSFLRAHRTIDKKELARIFYGATQVVQLVPSVFADRHMMKITRIKKAIFQADPNKGFIASFIAPVSAKVTSPFTMFDATLMTTLTVGFLLVVRFLLAR